MLPEKPACRDPAWKWSRSPSLGERLIGLGTLSRSPVERVVLIPIASPGIKRVHHMVQFGLELGDGTQQDSLQRRHRLMLVVINRTLFVHGGGSIVGDPLNPETGVELGPEAGG